MFSSLIKNGTSLARAGLNASRWNITSRCMSDQTFKNVNLDMDLEKGIAVLSMNKPPVNSLSLEMITDMNMALTKLEDERKCKGVILTSAQPKIFSAGLDILEMYQPEPERLRAFWSGLQDLWATLYGTNLVTLAAINGNSPAGGCLLSMGCDYRMMAEGKFSIGLNETKLGIVAPFWFQDAMKNTVGQRHCERAMQLGLLYSAEEALAINLIDEIVPQANILDKAKEEITKWVKIPALARIVSKQQLRSPTLEKFAQQREADLDNFVSFIVAPGVQKDLGRYMEGLKKKSS